MRNLLLVVMLSTLPTAAQAPASLLTPLELSGNRQRPQPIGAREAIRAADDPVTVGMTPTQRAMQSPNRIEDNFLSVELSVIINLNGPVESAKPIH